MSWRVSTIIGWKDAPFVIPLDTDAFSTPSKCVTKVSSFPSSSSYFKKDNDVKVRAPFDALHLAKVLGRSTFSIDEGAVELGRTRAMDELSLPSVRDRWPS